MKSSRENTRKGTKRSTGKSSQPQPYNSNYQSSETIIKLILDKITTLAFYEGFSKEIEKNMGDFCYNHIKKEITSFFELNFINYTNTNNKESELLWEMEPPIENTWEEIFEPESEPIDRYESAQINYKEIKRDNDNLNQIQEKENLNLNLKTNLNNKNKFKIMNQNSNNINKKISDLNTNIISEVDEKSNLSGFEGEVKIEKGAILEVSGIENKFSESLNVTESEIKKNIENVPDIFNNEDKISRKEERKTTRKKTTLRSIATPQNEELPPIHKKSRNNFLVNYPSVDIPGIEKEFNHHNLEPKNVDLLRQEREELIQKKLMESKAEKIINKVKKNNEENDKKPKKLFDAKHLTFDSNGNIINFHQYKLDKLKKEFALIKNLIKGEPQEENSKSKGKTNYRGRERRRESTKNIEEEKPKEIIEKPVQMEEKTIKEREKYIPSGSNFQIISPNIGVTVKENNRLKQGSKEFSKYFQKYSLRDYDKMLNDFVPLQNKTLIQNKLKKLNASSSNDYIPTISNNSVKNNNLLNKKPSNLSLANSYDFNNNINNPLLTDATVMNNSNNMNTINVNNSLSNSNPLLSSNLRNNNSNINLQSYKYKSINIKRSIVLKKLGIGSLKLEIENLKDLNTINPAILNRTNRTKNIFRYNSHKNYKNLPKTKEYKVNVFAEFNKKIMNSREWGNDLSSKKKLNTEMGFNDNNKIYARHMTKQQILMELGSNILRGIKIRLPRDRKVDINENL